MDTYCHDVSEDFFETISRGLPSLAEIGKLSEFFKALGTPSRLTIIAALAQEELCGCDLSVITGLTKSSISHQLRILRQVNLVDFRKEGKRSVYFLSDSHVRELFRNAYEHVNELPQTSHLR